MKYNFDVEINRLNTVSQKWEEIDKRFGTKDVIPMWVADMDFRSPEPVINALKERVDHGVFGYSFRTEAYYKSIIHWLSKRHDWKVKKEWIANGVGVVPSLAALVNIFTEVNDKVMIQTPVYQPFTNVVKNQGRKVIHNPLRLENGKYRMDFADMRSKMDDTVKVLILCSPHNPGGRVWTYHELKELGEICMENDVLIISDEIHFDLTYGDRKHIPIASISEALSMNTITCVSASKTFNIFDLNTSNVIIPNESWREKYNEYIKNLSLSSPNTFGMIAVEAAYRYGEAWLEALLVYLKGNLEYVKKYLEDNIPEIQMMMPEATYLVWLDCRGLGLSTDELDQFMIEKAKIGMNEGHFFGQDGHGFMRMNIGCTRSLLKQALNQLESAVKSLDIE